MDLKLFNETKVGHKVRMSSIIINSFYRALTNIEENEGIKNLTVKKLTTLLVDILYPEDGVLTWENEKTLKIKFNGKVPVEEETHSVEITIPVAEPVPEPAAPEPAAPEPEVKEIKVKETKPKLTKEQKEAEKAAAKAEKEAKAAEAKAEKEAKAAEAKAAKAAEAKSSKAAKSKFVGNLEKLNPTQDKLWKKVAAESKVDLTDDHKKQFLAHINELDNTEYNTKKLETWMSEFFAPKEETKTKDVEMFVVEYKGKEYFVDENEDVYETVPGTDVEKKVGKIGMAYFKDMVMPE
jgi:colicin import membrane protein